MTDGPTGKRDFFVSFNSADRAWAEWIAWTLEDKGYSVFFQDWDFRGNFVLEMDKAHRETRRTIAVLSPDYLTSRFCQAEWAARFAQDAASEHDLLIPMRVRPFELEGLLAPVIYVDLVGCDEEMAKKRLLDRVSGIRTKPDEPPLFPGEARHEAVPKRPAFPRPYPGLAAFRTDQAPFFFGRKCETKELIKRLKNPDCRFLAVVGASGTGKSSLIHAGLIPRLLAGDAIDGSETWCVKSFKPSSQGENPFLALATYGLEPFLPQYNGGANDLAGELARSPASITGFVDQALAGASPSAKLVWFIDQFEELFTQAKEEYRSGFVDLLSEAVDHPGVRVLATLREDFQSHALNYRKLDNLLQTTTGIFPLGRPGDDALRDMIRCPAEVAGVAVEDDLVEAIIVDAGDDLGVLPLVAFCLERLWLSVDKNVPQPLMTLEAYKKKERLQGVIANYTDQLLENLRQQEGADLDHKLRVIFAALVTVDDAGQAIRKRTLRSPTLDGVGQLVDKLIKGRLLLAQRGKDKHETVELVQDILLDKWPALKSWIDENRRDIILWRLLAAAADRWRNASWRYRNAYLWRGHGLKEAKQLVKRWRHYNPAKIETENIIRFIRASIVRKWEVIISTVLVVHTFSIVPFTLIMLYITPSLFSRNPMPVGSFSDNHPFGFYDVLGNVWEWTHKCFILQQTTTDSSAQVGKTSRWCLARGGSWDNHEEWKVHAAYRLSLSSEHEGSTVGFRVAREVDEGDKVDSHIAREVNDEVCIQDSQKDCISFNMVILLPEKSFKVTIPEREKEPCKNKPSQQEAIEARDKPEDDPFEPFAIGKFEVTIREWNACVKATKDMGDDDDRKCKKKENGPEILINKDRPITDVSWHDANNYVNWLSYETKYKMKYRLPDDAEWEYAARGNTDTCWWWGDEFESGKANCTACGLTWNQFSDWFSQQISTGMKAISRLFPNIMMRRAEPSPTSE